MSFRETIRKLFSFNTILFFSLGLAALFWVKSYVQSNYPFDNLVPHTGMLKSKTLTPKTVSSKDQEQTLKVMFYDGQSFMASLNAHYLDPVMWVDDSVIIYTRPDQGFFSTLITTREGNRTTNTEYDNEMFHIVRKADDTILLDYDRHTRNLRNMMWLYPLMIFSCLFFYFMRRSPAGKHLVIGRTRIDI